MSADAAETFAFVIRRRIESRYRRILFVHHELVKLDTAAKDRLLNITEKESQVSGKSALTIESFEDFVFNRIDFSVYKKIAADEFNLLFDEGLSDYEEKYYRKTFNKTSQEIRRIIHDSYIRAGPFYLCKKNTPLLLSIMRTLHSSLEFAPLLTGDSVTGGEQLQAVVDVLDGMTIRHEDGAETKLFTPEKKQDKTNAKLFGTFYPLGKAYTIPLIF